MELSDNECQAIRQAFADCDGLLITAGAGMGVDSGLPDFRGREGFWQAYPALAQAGLLHRKDTGQMALGWGGRWDEAPPRTQGLAMTYAGYHRRGEAAAFDQVTHPWNVHRLQTLIHACQVRSMNRLKVITVGEAARFMTCACVYGMAEIPVLSIAAPSRAWLAHQGTEEETATHWMEWAANLFSVGRS